MRAMRAGVRVQGNSEGMAGDIYALLHSSIYHVNAQIHAQCMSVNARGSAQGMREEWMRENRRARRGEFEAEFCHSRKPNGELYFEFGSRLGPSIRLQHFAFSRFVL